MGTAERVVDACVVGAGPAGTAAAITLARAGRDVVVVDRAQFPREKCCGDGLTADALRWLEQLGLRPADLPSWMVVDDAWVRSPSGRTIRFPLPRGSGMYAAVAPRAELDGALVDVARAAGAKVHDGHALVGAAQDRWGVTLTVDGLGPIRARYAIGADGMWSPLAKALGVYPDAYLGEWHAFRQYFTAVAAPARDLWVWFEPDLLPGYAWSFPLPDGRANVGLGIPRTAGQSVRAMKDTWPDLLARPHVRAVIGADARPEAPHRAWPIPARIETATLATGRALFVGDAAGATDPMTGEGIAQALRTGVAAAESLMAAGPDDPARAERLYRRAAHNALAADHRLARTLSRLLSRPRTARATLRAAGASEWTRRNFARWLFEDYPRAILLTPRRWHRGMLAGPGAYR